MIYFVSEIFICTQKLVHVNNQDVGNNACRQSIYRQLCVQYNLRVECAKVHFFINFIFILNNIYTYTQYM